MGYHCNESVNQEIQRRVQSAIERDPDNQTVCGIPRLTELGSNRPDPTLYEPWNPCHHIHNPEPDNYREPFCAGRLPVDPYGFEDCDKRAICVWDGVPLCAECSEEKGLCDGEMAVVSEIVSMPLVGALEAN